MLLAIEPYLQSSNMKKIKNTLQEHEETMGHHEKQKL